jgi:uncharacterized membrane protein
MQSKLFLLIMSFPIFIIALGWTFLGAWPVLPFAGLDFLLLAYVTYKVSYRSYQMDWIKLDKYKITIHTGIGDHPGDQVMARCDTYLYVTKPKKPLDLIHLRLKDNNHSIEVGEFLNKEDREQVRNALVNAGVVECVDQWWKR